MNAISGFTATSWTPSPFAAPRPEALGQTLGDALVAVGTRSPDAVALIDHGRKVTFAELLDAIGGLVDQIRDASATPGPLAVLLSAGLSAVAAWFASAAAGRPLLLLETRNPLARNRQLIANAGAILLLHDGAADADKLVDVGMRALDARTSRTARRLALGEGLGVDEPAMIFPTSGSTGEPKLIAYSSRTMQAKAQASIALMRAAPGDVAMIAGSHANYGYMHHALVFMLAGGALCVQNLDGAGLLGLFDAILHHGVRHVRFTPSLFRAAAGHPASHAALSRLKAARFSGEPFLTSDFELARQRLDPSALIQNVYGSTESQLFIWSSDLDERRDGEIAPLGRIYPNAEFKLVDEDGAPAPPGEPGELVISSPYQALGDWRGGELDRQRFPPDPRGGERRLYHTGDVVRPTADGGLTMLGRKDRIVKVNGQRISLMELENHLRAMPEIGEAAVLERMSASGSSSLAAFMTPTETGGAKADARGYLAARLPAYMIPARFQWLDSMPLLPGGKIDGNALIATLPAETPSAPDDGDGLVNLWRRVLKIADSRPGESFFDLGGDSLKLLELSLGLEALFGKRLEIGEFLEEPTLTKLIRTFRPTSMVIRAFSDDIGAPSFRMVRRAEGSSKGVVLALPGYGGCAQVGLLLNSGALAQFDIWAADVELASGNFSEDFRWRLSAERIAEALNAKSAPRPTVLFGASIAGYLAFLVDRLLIGGGRRPRRLIAVDAPPMHRMPFYRNKKTQTLTRAYLARPANMLHLRRARTSGFDCAVASDLWNWADVTQTSAMLQTIDHSDAMRRTTLALYAATIDRYVAEDGYPAGVVEEIGELDTFGGRLFTLLSADRWPAPATVAALLSAFPVTGSAIAAQALQFLAIATLDLERARRFATRLAARRPEFRVTRYAAQKLNDLLSQQGSKRRRAPRPEEWPPIADRNVILANDEAIDYALSLRLEGPDDMAPQRDTIPT